jgi:hypothetical protein
MAARLVDEVEHYRQHIREQGSMLSEPLFTSSGKVVGQRQVPKPAGRMLRDAERQLERWPMLLAIPTSAQAAHGLAQVKAHDKFDATLSRWQSRPDRGPG